MNGPPRPSALVYALTVLAGLSICLLAAGVIAPGVLGIAPGIALAVGGLVLVVSLTWRWRLYHRRDRWLW